MAKIDKLPRHKKKELVDKLKSRMEFFQVGRFYMAAVRLVYPKIKAHQVKNLLSTRNQYVNQELYKMLMDIFNPNKV
jgi:hypothetical protein